MTEPRPDDLFKPGDIVNHTYRIEAILGRGGTSDVYRARSEISGRPVAIKVFRSESTGDLDFLSLMKREEEMREIRHDAVVRYSENHRTADGHVFLVMDYVDGPGLDRKMREAPIPSRDLLVICRRVCSGLEAAHARHIVHRDLSPDNIILENGDPAQAVIIDFGIAKDANPGAETIVGNEFAGKYAYAAPEQLAGRVDHRADIYSLGALLLACYRGKPPAVGRNPIEVIELKSAPLDISDVPDPLGTILVRMTHPDPAQRFQTAAEVIAAIDALDSNGITTPTGYADDDMTLIVPASRQRDAPLGIALPGGAQKRRRMHLPVVVGSLVTAAVALIGVLFLIGVFDWFTAPAYPAVEPFTLRMSREDSGPLEVSGYIPDEETLLALKSRSVAEGGRADLTLASGEIGRSWGLDVRALLEILDPLDSFEARIEGDLVMLTGASADRSALDAVVARLDAGMPGALSGAFDLRYAPPLITVEEIEQVIAGIADCGALDLVAPPALGYGQADTVRVAGALSSGEALTTLREAVTSAASPRPVSLDVAILNPNLCLVDNFLPTAPRSDISIRFANGGGGTLLPNQTGVFYVGQNPVIDVVLPAEVIDGYLSVSFVDVSGDVWHLLPNQARPDNSIEALRDGQEGELPIRVAHEQGSGSPAFRVGGDTLGKSKIIVLHSSAPLFTPMRPRTESADSYAQSLGGVGRPEDTQILSLDTRLLTTAAR